MKASPPNVSEFIVSGKPLTVKYSKQIPDADAYDYFQSTIDRLERLSRLPKVQVFEPAEISRQSSASWKIVRSSSGDSISLAQEFKRLKNRWHEETSGLSSITRILLNYHYLKIISLGPSVISLILAELAAKPDHWFMALAVLRNLWATSFHGECLALICTC